MNSKIIIIFILIFFPIRILLATNAVNPEVLGSNIDQLDSLTKEAGYSSVYSPGNSIEEIIANIIQYLLSFLGIIFIILTIYAGFLWMTAQGESDQVSKAKEIMINAIIGIAVVLSSYVITSAILTNLGKAIG